MTNPSSIVRIHSRKGGRASVLEANMPFQLYGMGLLTGNGVVASSGLTVTVGGSSGSPDVLIAENPSGYKVALDVIGTANLTLTAPSSNKKIVSIVAYTNDLSVDSTESTTTGSPASCGLIAVNGTAASNPTAPNDSKIRTEITSDGGTGSQAAYAVIANITIASNTSTITNSLISIKRAVTGMLDIFYPVGSYYETSDTSFDPNISWGGTWAEDSSGRVLVAKDNSTFSTVGSTGGSEKHHHEFGLQLPTHYGSGGWEDNDTGMLYYDSDNNPSLGAKENVATSNNDFNAGAISSAASQLSAVRRFYGGSKYDTTLQPYVVIKRWHRTA